MLFYVAGLVLVAPLVLAEFAIGRRGRADPSGSIAVIAQAGGVSRRWALAGAMGALTGIVMATLWRLLSRT